MSDDATPAKVRLTDGLGPLTATAFMYARRYGSALTFNLTPEDTEDVDDEDPRPPKPLYLLTPEDVAAVNAARKARAEKVLRRLDLCKCDHNEYCGHCYPVEFRTGGVWGAKPGPPRCDGCGKTIAEHDSLLRCSGPNVGVEPPERSARTTG